MISTLRAVLHCRRGRQDRLRGVRALERIRELLGSVADVVPADGPTDLGGVLADLAARGVAGVLVKGGRWVHTEFLVSGLAEELRLAIAPFWSETRARADFFGNGGFPWHAGHPARLADVARIGNVALLRYVLSDRYPR